MFHGDKSKFLSLLNILEQPDLSAKIKEREQPVNQSKKVLKVEADTSTGTSDLKLNWEVFKYMEQIMDPCKLIVPFSKDNIIHDEALKAVETIEKFSTTDMYGKELILDVASLFEFIFITLVFVI